MFKKIYLHREQRGNPNFGGNNMKKVLAIVLAAIIMTVALVSCGGASSAKIKGVYLSPASYSYNNMRPAYNFYLLNYAQSEVTLYDNGTYMIIVSDATFSGIELSESTNDATANERTNVITKLFGTYTSTPNDLDEDLLDVALATPTRIVKSYDQQYWLDTDAWTDAMGQAVAPKEYDGETGQVTSTGTPLTAEQYLAENAFAPKTIQVNTKTSSFDFDSFGVKTGFQN